MRRRDFVLGSTMIPLSLGLAGALIEQATLGTTSANAEEGASFGPSTVREEARKLADKAFQRPEDKLPEPFGKLSYDRYRDIRFRTDRSLWRGTDTRFEVQLLHRGFLYANRVDLFEVVDGQARPIRYTPDLFNFERMNVEPTEEDLGFSGFRLHAPMNSQDYFDEVAVFQGASYFRAVARAQKYGLSARGLSVKTGDPAGEEFPRFKTFWLERPRPGANSCVVHALLDSESATAAYRFTIRHGDPTIMDVEMAVFPRADIAQPGLATLTSMFFFDQSDRLGVDDFRPGVHDSDGLALWNGRGERIWRPLANPQELQISVFQDVNPRGFGLMQRQRGFGDYQDLEARYERRPSFWVEPIGDWGEGGVHLVEIPTPGEIHDNIVAFWRPREAMRRGGEYNFTYRLHWCWSSPFEGDLGRAAKTYSGKALGNGNRLFVIDFSGGKLKDLPAESALRPVLSASAGKLDHAVVQRNPETGGWRLSFQLAPDNATLSELRAQIFRDQEPLSEVWTYRWTP